MNIDESRRDFFRAAAKVGAFISAPSLLGSLIASEPTLLAQESSKLSFISLPAAELQNLVDSLQSKPGAKFLVDSKQLPFSARVLSEQATGGKEFEFHEHTDHIFRVLEGTTHFDLGGTPEHAHLAKPDQPGEWLAPHSKGSTSIDMSKGDMLIIPRGTPHKRTTKESVVLWLVSVMGPTPS